MEGGEQSADDQQKLQDEAELALQARQAVVRREVETQKKRVQETYELLEATLPPEEFSELAGGPELLGPAGLRHVFPEWLRERPDFQYVFPRFATEPLDELSLVAFGMAKELKKRTTFDIDKTVSFLSQLECFKNLARPLMETLTKSVHVTHHPAGKRLFAAGDPAQTLFIVMAGKVELRLASGALARVVGPGQAFGERALASRLGAEYECSAHVSTPPARARRASLRSTRSLMSGDSGPIDTSCGASARGTPAGTPVASSSSSSSSSGANGPGGSASAPAGGSSGAAASAAGSAVLPGGAAQANRSGVLRGLEHLEGPLVVLELSAQDFRSVTKLFNQSQNLQLSRFLQSNVRLFSKWSKHRINQVAPLLTQRSFNPGDKIQRSDEPAEELYFVYAGVCDMQREVVETRTNRWPKELVPEPEYTARGTTVVKLKHSLVHELREAKTVKSVHLARLGPGDYFGEEFLTGYARRRTTVIARGVTSVLVLQRADAESMFSARMVEVMRQAHHALFASDEAIMRQREREHELEQQFRNLKLAALGPQYSKRATVGRKSMQHSRSRGTLHTSQRLLSNKSAAALLLLGTRPCKHSRKQTATRPIGADRCMPLLDL